MQLISEKIIYRFLGKDNAQIIQESNLSVLHSHKPFGKGWVLHQALAILTFNLKKSALEKITARYFGKLKLTKVLLIQKAQPLESPSSQSIP